MSIQSIKNIIIAANNNMETPLAFQMGRGQAINIFYETPNLPLLWLITPNQTGTLIPNLNRIISVYSIELFVYYNDKVSNDEESSNLLIEQAEDYAKQLFKRIQITSDDFNLDINNISIIPVYKYSAKGVFTGVSVNFNIEIPDNNSIC